MSIDWWTLGLQAANFLVLIWLLQRFLYRPVLAIIARRQAQIAGVMDQADIAKAAAQRLERELASERAAIAVERDRVLQDARTQAEHERQATQAKAQADADALVADGRRVLEQERQEAVAAVQHDATTLGIDIARNLLARAPPPDFGTFLDGICQAIGAMRRDERGRLLNGANGAAVRVVTARPLAASDRAQCQARLAALLGKETPLAFADDPQLLAGIELHFPNSILRNTWRETLATTLDRLTRDEQARRHA